MAIVDDHMKAYERELVLDEAVRRCTMKFVLPAMANAALGDLGQAMPLTIASIRAEFARIMAAA